MTRRSPTTRAWPALWMFLAILLAALPAWADPTDEEVEKGRALAGEAMGFYKGTEYELALDKFEEAAKVYPAAQVLRMKGYTLIALKRYAEAVRTLEKAMKAEYKPLMPADFEHAEEQLEKAKTHVAKVTIKSSVAGAAVSVNGENLQKLPHTVLLDEGKHIFLVSAEGYEDRNDERTVVGGETVEFKLDPRKATPKAAPKPTPDPGKPTPKPSPAPGGNEPAAKGKGWFPYQMEVGLGVTGAGAALLVASLSTGIYSASLKGSVQENIDLHNQNYGTDCSRNDPGLCLADIALINRDGQRVVEQERAAIGTGIASAVLLGAGLTFIFTADSGGSASDGKDTGSPTVGCAPWAGFASGTTGLGCHGTF